MNNMVEKEVREKKVVQVGSTVVLDVIYPGVIRSIEDTLVVMISEDSCSGDFEKVSINSPIARCILGKEEGFSGEFMVHFSKIKVKILAIR